MIHETTRYTVPSGTVDACRDAIHELTDQVRNEQDGVASYLVMEEDEGDFTRYTHLAVFEDRQAREAHHGSPALRDFLDLIYPATRDGVTFEYQRVVDRVRRVPAYR